MISLFFVPLLLINLGLISNPLLVVFMYLSSGFGMAGIGMCVMHDAIHGSYSRNKTVNKYLGYTMNLVGANSAVWKIQHNVLHHTYTNIDKADDDINPPHVLRFSPHAKRLWFHRFQHIYVWFFYGLSTLSWVTSKDFIRMARYRRLGFLNGTNEYRNELLKMITWKLLYYCYTLVIPMIVLPVSWWVVLVAFLIMHFAAGLSMSLVFQTAHVMPNMEFPLPDEKGVIEMDWTVHQMLTTTNYAPASRILSWLIGGLNFQIEHHLLPNVCHVHYKRLAPIIRETAGEFGIPYNNKTTFFAAIQDHAKMLYHLGRSD